MGTIEHTPWRKIRLASSFDSRVAAFKIAYGAAGNTIAIVDGDGGAALLNEAHADRIVAAQDMYEALKALLATHKPGRGQCCAAADMAIDALQKATPQEIR